MSEIPQLKFEVEMDFSWMRIAGWAAFFVVVGLCAAYLGL